MKVSSPKFIDPDSTPEMSGFASSPVVRSSIVMSLEPPVETIVRISLPARIRSITSTNSSGPAARVPSSSRTWRWATVAPAAAAPIAESAISFGRVGDVRVVLAEDVGAGDRAGDDDRVLVPGAHPGTTSDSLNDARSASVIARVLRAPGSQRTRPNSASTTTSPSLPRIRSRVGHALRPSSRTAH